MREKRIERNQLRIATTLLLSLSIPLLILSGCATQRFGGNPSSDVPTQLPVAKNSYLEPSQPFEHEFPAENHLSPMAIDDYTKIEYEPPISLQLCIERALSSTEVIRDLGVNIVRSPNSTRTTLDPALVYSDPRFGEEAALSQFDANVAASMIFENNDRNFNSPFSGDLSGRFKQDLLLNNLEISKMAATGTLFSIRNNLEYDANNNIGNFFGSTWENVLESEFRHPLMQGSGVYFNRIAGPSQQPGVYNGILVARTNTEIGLSRFEIGVRDLISNVENAYWDLYYAYRELEAQIEARNEAFNLYQANKAKGAIVSALDIAGAREQYLRFENNIINSLEGRVIDGTRVDSGSSGGSFRATVGVRVAERRLRYLIGMPITDGKLLKPKDSPIEAELRFDWNESVHSAMSKRPERRQQKWLIKRRELELTAAKNFLLPRLDLVGGYRFRGRGKDLTGGGQTWNDYQFVNPAIEPNAFADLKSGDFQEWQLGAEMRLPLGFRNAHSAVRNAELQLQRERGVLREQDRAIILGLSNAVAETRRANAAMQVASTRKDAAIKYREAAKKLKKLDQVNINVLLEAERRVLEATLQLYRAETEYAIAIKNVHVEKGSLLEYNGVFLQESTSDSEAYRQSELKFQSRKRKMSYVVKNPAIGEPINQQTIPMMESGQNGIPIIPVDETVDPVPTPQPGIKDNLMPLLTPIEYGDWSRPEIPLMAKPGWQVERIPTNPSQSGEGQLEGQVPIVQVKNTAQLIPITKIQNGQTKKAVKPDDEEEDEEEPLRAYPSRR